MNAVMNHSRAPRDTARFAHVLARGAVAAALVLAGLAGTVEAREIEAPTVPQDLSVDGRVFRISHAYGTQNYLCLPRPNGVGNAWAFVGPQATLFDLEDEQVMTHYLSVNPDEGIPRATWLDSRDSSAVWAKAVATVPDPAGTGSIPWLKLEVVGDQDGPTGGDRLTKTTFIQRINTEGGSAPAGDCPTVGMRIFVPYETDYVFFRAP